MFQNQIEFSYNGVNIIMQCKANEKLKDIFKNFKYKIKAEKEVLIYMYNEIIISNEELTFEEISNSEDKKRKKMNILVIKEEVSEVHQYDNIIKSKDIICPDCNEDIKLNIEDYIINLFGCKNNHNINNIFLDKFESTQNKNISKIICQKCKKYNKGNVHNNKFYICNSCKMNICPICFSNHDKKHNIINYDDKNYICSLHNKIYNAYCEKCNQNICIYCEQNHFEHNIISHGKSIPDLKQKKNILLQIEEAKNK